MNNKIQSGIYTLIILLVLTACGGGPQNAMPPAATVKTDTVELKDPIYYDIYPGNVVALNTVVLNSEVSGFITGIYFQEGQQVRKGQKLYEIEQSKYQAAYSSADASLKIAQANFEKTRKDAERYKQLGEKGMTTQQRLEYSEADLQTAESQVTAAKANLQRAQIDLQHSIIIAPFDGTIGISLVKMGAFVTAGQTKLNTVSSNDPISIDFVVNEKEISHFVTLEQRKLTKYDSLFTLALPDNSIYPYPGKILFLDRAVDMQTGTLKIRLEFPNPKKALKDGMSCNVRVENKHADKVVVIPNKAVTEQMGEYFVYVVEQDTARQHKVKIGKVVGKNIVIQEGLKPGEQIIVEGIQKLRDGVAVQTGDPQAQAPKK
ncbi:efflux RND transporter periplasmic adaptor subunit [Cytophaga hutchinsonii]|uniref:Acriflavine resistance protein E n=1 Tax=Cytophaga hutchinsonii (strain ATCC 33406 / DSM 1761 / CIP 103989 / NBRC 15051 / NCIMB 9469 / D465) TaxID=269798 RepID=A0A6N4SPJ6_CYTH3|nr:efflux RND transporter periplasmic adaptor subunit [Cytophaga hutchinsonii]ABG58221.1 acriflavine resistance protein E [Cytophaga hutchinsonii ATCC 33406]SFX54762.1 membrane fusion protein, multidrug efflux system [Cytophaga hutchinsonii ATCC 33406]